MLGVHEQLQEAIFSEKQVWVTRLNTPGLFFSHLRGEPIFKKIHFQKGNLFWWLNHLPWHLLRKVLFLCAGDESIWCGLLGAFKSYCQLFNLVMYNIVPFLTFCQFKFLPILILNETEGENYFNICLQIDLILIKYKWNLLGIKLSFGLTPSLLFGRGKELKGRTKPSDSVLCCTLPQ